MKASEFCDTLIDIAVNKKTLYILGCFGAPMSNANKNRYTSNYAYNAREDRATKIRSASADTFGFDCICLPKGVQWGWCGDINDEYGGAKYQSNGLKDVTIEEMMASCGRVSTDFTDIRRGEIVHVVTPDYNHVGIYVGGGRVVEATSRWDDGVQVTKLGNVPSDYQSDKIRTWDEHGLLPFIEYEDKTLEQLAEEVYKSVNNLVKAALSGDYKTNEQIAMEVINGKWGNGEARKIALTNAGYNYTEIQHLVNKIVNGK